jgi:hypothetical protein
MCMVVLCRMMLFEWRYVSLSINHTDKTLVSSLYLTHFTTPVTNTLWRSIYTRKAPGSRGVRKPAVNGDRRRLGTWDWVLLAAWTVINPLASNQESKLGWFKSSSASKYRFKSASSEEWVYAEGEERGITDLVWIILRKPRLLPPS